MAQYGIAAIFLILGRRAERQDKTRQDKTAL